MMKQLPTAIDLIGNTPLVEVKCFDVGLCRLFLKLENQNPGGSIKDRIGRSLIQDAERRGVIKPGDTLVEATAGNTGLGLALAAITRNYKLILVIPDKMSAEKLHHLRALGAEIRLTRSDVERGHPEYYLDMAKRIADETPGAYFINQFNNPANPLAHEQTTGPEIWKQTGHAVDAIVVGVGSGGTLRGLTNYFRRVKPELEMVLADPEGSVLADVVEGRSLPQPGSWLVEGIGEDLVPPLFDCSLISKAYTISDAESFAAAHRLLREEGILAGSSSGTLISAAVKYAREQQAPKNIVTFVCDSGSKYLTKMFNDFWLADRGLLPVSHGGGIAELVTRRFMDRNVITVKPEDSLLTAHAKMSLYDISQLPVLQGDQLLGVIEEGHILKAADSGHEQVLYEKVGQHMSSWAVTVSIHDQLSRVSSILKTGQLVIVLQEGRLFGIITKTDYIHYLRRKLK